MSQPLDGAFAKIARAHQHFECVKAKITSAADYADAVTFAQKFDSDTGTIKVTLQGVPQLPLEWALTAADAYENLRAALNYLAWELAKWNLAQRGETREPEKDTQFPINTKPRRFSARKVTDLHPDQVARIKRLQPNAADHLSQFPEFLLQNSNPEGLAASHPLALLAEFTNTDKHRVLQPALVSSSETQLGPYEPTDCLITHTYITPNLVLENGADWVSFDVTPDGPEPKVEVNDEITPQVTFGGWPIERAFPQIAAEVRAIITSFQPPL